MTAEKCRLAAALLLAQLFLAGSIARADDGHFSLERRFDVPVARALDRFFGAADTEELTMRGFGHIRHVIDLASVRVWASERLALRFGVGVASLINSPLACPAETSGTAVTGSVYYGVLQPRGLSLGVELSTLQIRYASGAGLSENSVLVALSSR